MPLRVTRRHLVWLEPSVPVDPEWPVVWHVGAPVYFRPESHGLLASPCDQVDCPPGEPPVEESAILDLSTSLSQLAPALADAQVRSAWTCNRTLTPDDRVCIGPDPGTPGLFWIAGLGGQGMSTGVEAGRLAAEALTGAAPPELRELAPGRFRRSGGSL